MKEEKRTKRIYDVEKQKKKKWLDKNGREDHQDVKRQKTKYTGKPDKNSFGIIIYT